MADLIHIQTESQAAKNLTVKKKRKAEEIKFFVKSNSYASSENWLGFLKIVKYAPPSTGGHKGKET